MVHSIFIASSTMSGAPFSTAVSGVDSQCDHAPRHGRQQAALAGVLLRFHIREGR